MDQQPLSSVMPHDPVRAITAFHVISVEPKATTVQVAQAMRDYSCSALLIETRTGGHAILTERDVVDGLASHGPDAGDWAVDLMTTDLVTIPADMAIVDAAEAMIDAGIRHLIVSDADTDSDDEPRIGVVSIRDLLEPLLNGISPTS